MNVSHHEQTSHRQLVSCSSWLPRLPRWLTTTPTVLTDSYIDESKLLLPSWVPRWNQTLTLYNPSFWVTSSEAAKGVPCLAAHRGSGQLVVRAYIVDSLFAIGKHCPTVSYSEQVAGSPREEVIEVVQQWRNLHAIMSASTSEEQQVVPFWRTVTMDRIFQENLLSRRRWTNGDFLHALIFETWLRNPSSLEYFANPATRNRVRSNILGALADRTFFTTSKRRIGIVQCTSDKLRDGDAVALLAGLHTPAILRPYPVDNGTVYEFVAPCYTDGLMYGEALEQSGISNSASLFSEITLI